MTVWAMLLGSTTAGGRFFEEGAVIARRPQARACPEEERSDDVGEATPGHHEALQAHLNALLTRRDCFARFAHSQ